MKSTQRQDRIEKTRLRREKLNKELDKQWQILKAERGLMNEVGRKLGIKKYQ